uniref:Uncharacterized protein n=1 Tax=Setaria viridis TaxID=4556 RepID=A0A4U6UY86_SETVI|nr:hypothetical protein SEVIR_4G096203v2 [Setaria viridis]
MLRSESLDFDARCMTRCVSSTAPRIPCARVEFFLPIAAKSSARTHLFFPPQNLPFQAPTKITENLHLQYKHHAARAETGGGGGGAGEDGRRGACTEGLGISRRARAAPWVLPVGDLAQLLH